MVKSNPISSHASMNTTNFDVGNKKKSFSIKVELTMMIWHTFQLNETKKNQVIVHKKINFKEIVWKSFFFFSTCTRGDDGKEIRGRKIQ